MSELGLVLVHSWDQVLTLITVCWVCSFIWVMDPCLVQIKSTSHVFTSNHKTDSSVSVRNNLVLLPSERFPPQPDGGEDIADIASFRAVLL